MAFIAHGILSDSWWYIQLAAVPVRFIFLFRVFKLRCCNCYSTLRFWKQICVTTLVAWGIWRDWFGLGTDCRWGDGLVSNLDSFSFKKFNSSCSHLCPSLWLRKIKHFMLSEFFLWNSVLWWVNQTPCAISLPPPRPPLPSPCALIATKFDTSCSRIFSLKFRCLMVDRHAWLIDWLIACLRFLQIWHFLFVWLSFVPPPFQCGRYDTSCSRTLSLEFRSSMEIHVHEPGWSLAFGFRKIRHLIRRIFSRNLVLWWSPR